MANAMVKQVGKEAHANDASLVYDPPCGEGKYILTPPASPRPRLHGPAVFGVRPGAPFLYTIPATGEKPIRYSVVGLPAGLRVDAQSGVVSGTIEDRTPREYALTLKAENERGTAEKPFTIFVGDTICLTPPMGWNSWNCWQGDVSQKHVYDSAVSMVTQGLRDVGWSYINIDDAWQGLRGGEFNAIQPDPDKFPDIQAMCNEIHALGLKVGIYSTPWVTTYAGRIGGSSDTPEGEWSKEVHAPDDYRPSKVSYRVAPYVFDENDAAQWAAWGIDYLKYDWRPNDPESTIRMAEALKGCGRDVVYSLSNGAPIEHAELYGRIANCWRTAGDLKDRWDQDGCHLNIIEQWEQHRNWIEQGMRGGPGHFPDPDMLVVGELVTSHEAEHAIAPSQLTPDEQYSHISLWVLWAAPLLIGCPIETLDAFTLNLLTNSEVLEVHQDSVAVPGISVRIQDGIEIVVKELADGGKAIGLFNLNDEAQVVTLDWREAGLEGKQTLRDLWRQTDLGVFEDRFSARVRSHGVVLIRTQ
ncbi:Alpha-galactosidase A [Pontiella desulfatans]|uniref:Alpha-galactosidase n=1 Tax=Pontiella desulfatans TaxID=2750659 RepID=A0A6C2UDD7_PONDE|nr:putative Ig domain-containing protein [Pontiella desulfatans]VGO17431.1 Alpha-galactosidase A [Pontiella desulfatans]